MPLSDIIFILECLVVNLSPGPMRTFVGVLLILSMILSYILILTPAREHIELAIIRQVPQSIATSTWGDILVRNLIRTALVAATAAVAVRAPYFGSAIGVRLS